MRSLFILLKCTTLGGLLLAAAGFLGRYSTYADLTAHFSIYYFLLFVILTLIFIPAKKWAWMMTAMLGVVLSIIPPTLAYIPRSASPQSAGPELTFLQFNVNYANPTPEKVIAWITSLITQADRDTSSRAPDIILLQELSPYMANALAPLLDKQNTVYPYKIVAPRPGAFGMALLSRHPLRDIQRASFSAEAPEHTLATVMIPDGQTFRLYETHTLPPISSQYSSIRNNELMQLADIISADPGTHKVFLGDFNITPYSAWFRDTENRSGLKSAMRGLGIQAFSNGTWPAFLPALFRIPIDHLLVSEKISVIKRDVGPDLGSDHLPVLTVLRFSPPLE
jgi:endonuclease/exonuclease/phosphatase (EEP) superfamily protein YafD